MSAAAIGPMVNMKGNVTSFTDAIRVMSSEAKVISKVSKIKKGSGSDALFCADLRTSCTQHGHGSRQA